FRQESVQRELLAVNQEHQKNIEHDGWRAWMIFKETQNQNHPNAKFSTGTEETLKIIPLETLRSWFKTYYGANRMHLIIYSNEPINSLIDIAQKSFGAIPPTLYEPQMYGRLTSEEQRGHITFIEPIQTIKELSI